MWKLTCWVAALLVLGACESKKYQDDRLAASIALALTTACPQGDDPGDEAARDRCADKLAVLPELRQAMVEPFLWGGQPPAGGYSLEKGVSKFNPLVWRRLYLSTFMFGGDCATVEHVDGLTVVHVPVWFRGAMPTGAYPYPFWHSERKWDAYNYATTIHFILKGGKLVGALRSLVQDTTRPKTARVWDHTWGRPRVSLYDYVLSKPNPFAARLTEAYHALESRMRKHHCDVCHAPDDQGGAQQLDLLVFPNQALSSRHAIVEQVTDDQMPPDNDLDLPAGIADPAERDSLLDRARSFEAAGDAALAWEDRRMDR